MGISFLASFFLDFPHSLLTNKQRKDNFITKTWKWSSNSRPVQQENVIDTVWWIWDIKISKQYRILKIWPCPSSKGCESRAGAPNPQDSRRWVAGERVKLHLPFPITPITAWTIPLFPILPLTHGKIVLHKTSSSTKKSGGHWSREKEQGWKETKRAGEKREERRMKTPDVHLGELHMDQEVIQWRKAWTCNVLSSVLFWWIPSQSFRCTYPFPTLRLE